ncbi:MAG TPA: hypothetical protein VN775_00780 [Opitutaceae bacterium]|nr:hypothetical protein [Opitutaceae bacterium]
MRVPGALLLVVAIASARAGNPPASAGDSIAAAKKDLASIKAPASTMDPGPGIAGIGLREDAPVAAAGRADAAAALAEAGRPAVDPPRKNAGTGNWLVDAMERRSDHLQSAPARDGLVRGDIDLPMEAARPNGRGENGAKPGEAGGKAASRALAESVYNPLDAFMEGWISAQDRELLLPSTRGESPPGAYQRGSRAETPSGIDLGPQGASGGGVLQTRGAGPADLRTAANPYIADLSLASTPPLKPFSAPELPGIAPPWPLDLSRGISPGGVDPKSLDGSKSLIPDFVQPPDDDKYFKQIKRF